MYFNQALFLLDSIRPKIVGKSLKRVSEPYPKCYCLDFGSPTLLVSLNPSGFHLNLFLEGPTPHWANSLLGKKVETVNLLHNDLLLEIGFEGFPLVFQLFTRAPNLWTPLFSLFPQKDLPPPPLERKEGPLQTHEELAQRFLEWEKQRLQKELESKLTKAERALQGLQTQLRESEKWEETFHQGEMLQSQFYHIKRGMKELPVEDWITGTTQIIRLDPLLLPQENVALLFKKAKKQEAAIPHLYTQIGLTEDTINTLRQQLTRLHQATQLTPFRIPPKPPKEKAPPPIPYLLFYSSTGRPIWVGKNSKSNDSLTFQHAYGSDLWMHVSGFPGSHVVIHGLPPDPATLQEAQQLALFYSKGRSNGKGEVVMSLIKYISRLGKNNPGKVQVAKPTYQSVRLPPHFNPKPARS